MVRTERARVHPDINLLDSITRLGKLKMVILYEFYKKPMANRCPNLQKSRIPEGSNRGTASQECLRRLKNTSRELEPNTVKMILTEYMSELAQRGFSLKWRK